MATYSGSLNNIIDCFNFYKEKYQWNENTIFKLIENSSLVEINKAIKFNFIFKIGINYLYIDCYDCNINIEQVSKIKKYDEWEAYLILERLNNNKVIYDIIKLILNKNRELS